QNGSPAKHARHSADPEQQQAVTQWQHPPDEFIKCNIDATMFTSDRKVSIGMLMRDATSQFLGAISDVYHHAMAAAVSEAWSFLQGLKCIESLGDHN
ncbi:hypothetical protein A2U01_0074716, partial [Trifolium medium]|nr:hypothetical protein [Trifolium medium]